MLCKLHFPDIIIITESWINPQYPSNVLQIENYFLYRADRDSDGGGITIWSLNSCRLIPVCLPDTLKSDLLVLRIETYNILLIAV